MNQIFWKSLLVSPVVLGIISSLSLEVLAKSAPTVPETPVLMEKPELPDTELRSKIVVETDAETRRHGDAPEINVLRLNATWYETTELVTVQEKTDGGTDAIALTPAYTPFEELIGARPNTPEAQILSDISEDELVTSELLQDKSYSINTSSALTLSPSVELHTPELVSFAAELDNPMTEESSVALEPIDIYNNEFESMGQVTSVTSLSDVQPTDWAFEALRSLVERYGCIQGYPDGTYRGQRAMTRYEFAAGLNACLMQIERLLSGATEDFVARGDLDTIQRLTDEFRTELATLRTRTDQLEGRVDVLEARQFSTTTKLAGEAIFAIADVFGNERAGGGDLNLNTMLANRVRLNFDTSFTGRDRLRVRLQARNITPFNTNVTGTEMTRFGFDGNQNNNLEIDDFYYAFPLGRQTNVWLIANGFGSDNIGNPLNPLLQGGGRGSISRFGRFHSIYRLSEQAGIGLTHRFGDAVSLALAYRARNGNDPSEKAGLFDGQYGALAQLTLQPSRALGVGLTYVNYYSPGSVVNTTGSIGSAFAIRPFNRVATLAHAYGVQASLRVSPQFTVSGWAGYTNAHAKAGPNQGSSADIWNWAVTMALSDVGTRGSLLGFVVGMPPKVTRNEVANRQDRDTSLHLEGFYRYQLTRNIAITPGLLVILNPEHNNNNDNLWVGLIRTTFSF